MDLKKSPYFEAGTYTQDTRCWYCGLLNKVREGMINCVLNDKKLSWYTWCQACLKFITLTEKVYTLVQERLIQRIGCFQFPHKCTNTKLYTSIDRFQKKCKDHKDCWEYYCQKCLGVFHCSEMPLEVKKRMEEKKKEKEEVKKRMEEKEKEEKEEKEKEEDRWAVWEEAPRVENDRLLD